MKDTCGVMLLSKEMDTLTWVQIPVVYVCIPNSANILVKGMHPTILPSAMGK